MKKVFAILLLTASMPLLAIDHECKEEDEKQVLGVWVTTIGGTQVSCLNPGQEYFLVAQLNNAFDCLCPEVLAFPGPNPTTFSSGCIDTSGVTGTRKFRFTYGSGTVTLTAIETCPNGQTSTVSPNRASITLNEC